MTHPPILLFDFDGVVITQKALEYSALTFIRRSFYNWKNLQSLRLIDIARLFEESDSKNRLKAIIKAYKAYKLYIPSRWRRLLFFIKYRRMYPRYEIYEILNDGLEETLNLLLKKGVIAGIISNTSRKRLNYFKDKLNLDRYFSIFISREDTPYRKPHAYPVLLGLRLIKNKIKHPINKQLVYLIGDLPSDIECAKNAGIKSIALLSGHGKRKDLKEIQPSIIIEEIQDILKIELFEKLLLD